jgi:hypothetical protein
MGPVTVDPTGIAVCLQLDATKLARAHFMAQTSYRPGNVSPFTSTLVDASGTTLVDGWDITVGQTQPLSSTNLEWDAPPGLVTEVTLHVSDITGPLATSLQLALLDPAGH